jgi:hypothetical protein
MFDSIKPLKNQTVNSLNIATHSIVFDQFMGLVARNEAIGLLIK